MHETLLTAARTVAQRAYAPYSQFTVGAALLGKNGTTYLGCNVENASYGLTLCAERNALFHAIAEGCQSFEALALAAPKAVQPCGACLQVLAEFCDASLPILMTSLDGSVTRTATLGDFLPTAFALD